MSDRMLANRGAIAGGGCEAFRGVVEEFFDRMTDDDRLAVLYAAPPLTRTPDSPHVRRRASPRYTPTRSLNPC
jgi:truncated hemoglobin YjbI